MSWDGKPTPVYANRLCSTVTDAQLAACQERAKILGLTMAAYVREAALKYAGLCAIADSEASANG